MTPNISNKAFWDTNFKKLDFVAQRDAIISRIFEYGTWNDIKEIWKFYGDKLVIDALTNAEYLQEGTIYLASFIFNLKQSDFKCFGKKQYHPI